MTRASLRALAEHAPGSQFDVRRFRPNVLIDCDGVEFVEFGWSDARVAPAAVAQAGTTALKRGALRLFDALMPRGE